MMKTIKRLEMEMNQKAYDISNFSKETALTIRKYEIRLEANQEEIAKVTAKLSDK